MQRSKGVTVYGIAIIVFGFYNLIGVGGYRQFSLMFQPLPPPAIMAVYIFTIFYGICGVYCGTRILRLEDWARKLIVALASLSVVSGLLLNRMAMANFRALLISGQIPVAPELVEPVYRYMIALTALVTVFELSVIYYFTRSAVVRQFRPQKARERGE